MSVRAELDEFFGHLNKQAALLHEVSEQAFAQACVKLSTCALPHLNEWSISKYTRLKRRLISACLLMMNLKMKNINSLLEIKQGWQ